MVVRRQKSSARAARVCSPIEEDMMQEDGPVAVPLSPTDAPSPSLSNKETSTRSTNKKNRRTSTAPPPIEANRTDVLFGRGRRTSNWVGNQLYQKLIRHFMKRYKQASTNKLKMQLTAKIVLLVQKRGGRFLREKKGSNVLEEVSDEQARIKVGQALRHQIRVSEKHGTGLESDEDEDGSSFDLDEQETPPPVGEKTSEPLPTTSSSSSLSSPLCQASLTMQKEQYQQPFVFGHRVSELSSATASPDAVVSLDPSFRPAWTPLSSNPTAYPSPIRKEMEKKYKKKHKQSQQPQPVHEFDFLDLDDDDLLGDAWLGDPSSTEIPSQVFF